MSNKKRTRGSLANPAHLLPTDGNGKIQVVIETANGSLNKYAFDEDLKVFALTKVLPAVPYDFGFIPWTRAEDGDPTDVLVLMNKPTFPACLLKCRLIGVIEAIEEADHSWTAITSTSLHGNPR